MDLNSPQEDVGLPFTEAGFAVTPNSRHGRKDQRSTIVKRASGLMILYSKDVRPYLSFAYPVDPINVVGRSRETSSVA